MRDEFWLTQRVLVADRPSKTGFDRLFRLDYMGSAEFEFGAVPAALRSLRQTDVAATMRAIRVDGTDVDVWFVCDPAAVEEKAVRFQEWVNDGCPGKESSFFLQAAGFVSDRWALDVDAWWHLNYDVITTLSADVADRLVEAVQG